MVKKLKHEWHLMSGYCIFCGIDLKDAITKQTECIRDDKIQAISHTRAMSRVREQDVLRTTNKDNDSDT